MAITQVPALINGVVKNLNAGTDGSGNIAPGHVLLDASAAAFGVTGNEIAVKGGAAIVDGVTPTVKATVAQFHNADNQNPGGTAYGLLTGGVAQLLNAIGNIDRQREVGLDNVPAQGLTSSGANFAMAYKMMCAQNIAGGTTSTVYTVPATTGTVGGVPWTVAVGAVVTVDTGANAENGIVTAVTATTLTVQTAANAKPHNGTVTTFPITGFTFNQERDAAGESDGASGSGTAVAAEYEFNAGAPGGGNFDRARSLQAKAFATQTISSGGGAASKSIVVGAVTGLKAGMQVLLYKAATFPAAGSFETVYIDYSWNESATTVPLVSAIVNNPVYDTLAYDSFGPLGPQLNGFLPIGVGIEEEALYDPVSGKYYIERAATQDAMPTQNIVAETPALFNGSTADRQRGNVDTAALVTLSAAAAGGNSADQTNFNGRGVQIGLNVTAITGTTPSITVTVQGKDAASGVYYTLLQSAAISATGFTQLTVYPGAPTTANVSAPQVLPRTWRVLYAIAGTTPAVTATVGASVIV